MFGPEVRLPIFCVCGPTPCIYVDASGTHAKDAPSIPKPNWCNPHSLRGWMTMSTSSAVCLLCSLVHSQQLRWILRWLSTSSCLCRHDSLDLLFEPSVQGLHFISSTPYKVLQTFAFCSDVLFRYLSPLAILLVLILIATKWQNTRWWSSPVNVHTLCTLHMYPCFVFEDETFTNSSWSTSTTNIKFHKS